MKRCFKLAIVLIFLFFFIIMSFRMPCAEIKLNKANYIYPNINEVNAHICYCNCEYTMEQLCKVIFCSCERCFEEKCIDIICMIIKSESAEIKIHKTYLPRCNTIDEDTHYLKRTFVLETIDLNKKLL